VPELLFLALKDKNTHHQYLRVTKYERLARNFHSDCARGLHQEERLLLRDHRIGFQA
jgi:hypothetical protein